MLVSSRDEPIMERDDPLMERDEPIIKTDDPINNKDYQVWMSHGDKVNKLPKNFKVYHELLVDDILVATLYKRIDSQ